MPPVISVDRLSKEYRLGEIGTGTLADDLKVWWARTRGRPNPLLRIGQSDHSNVEGETIWALRDVSFDVQQGDVLGVIGQNGAGKSTLLKIVSRITAPTTGRAKVRGRIASLLEVGTGFHPELTGQENIYLNGAILGMSRKEVTRKFDEIVDFAGIEEFIDTPVKRYSNGMYVRLAFAVAAHLEPEILLVDEVLAVGDAEFQRKCLGKMSQVAREGRTVLFVSHNMAAVQALCETAILLRDGRLVSQGGAENVIAEYLRQGTAGDLMAPAVLDPDVKREGNGRVRILEWWIEDSQRLQGRRVRLGDECTFRLVYEALGPQSPRNVGMRLVMKDELGRAVTSSVTGLVDADFPTIPASGVFSCRIAELPLIPGMYTLFISCGVQRELADRIENAGQFEVLPADIYGTGRIPSPKDGVFALKKFSWEVGK